MSKVTVTAKEGKVVIPTSTDGQGYIRVESITPVFKNNNFKNEKRSSLIFGKIEDLTASFKEGQILPGSIAVVETTVKPNSKATPKINPTTGEVMKHNGLEVYRTEIYTPDNSIKDSYLENDRISIASSSPVGAHA